MLSSKVTAQDAGSSIKVEYLIEVLFYVLYGQPCHRDCGILPVNIGSTVPSFGSFILLLSHNLSPYSFFRSKFSRNL